VLVSWGSVCVRVCPPTRTPRAHVHVSVTCINLCPHPAMCARVCVCVRVLCIYMCTCVCVYCAYICARVCVCIVHIYVHVCVCVLYIYVHVCVCIVYTGIYARMYVCVYCAYICVHVCVCVRVSSLGFVCCRWVRYVTQSNSYVCRV